MKKLMILATLPIAAALTACGGGETTTEAENIEVNQTLDDFGFNDSEMPADTMGANTTDDMMVAPMNGSGDMMMDNGMATDAPANTMTP